MAEYTPLKDLLQQSDFVTLHAYLSPATRGMLGKTEFALMKPSAYLINTARGAMIDHHALFLALQAKQLAGAGLDVFDPEPIPKDHPLLGLPNVIITPHIASASLNTRRMMAKMTIENTLAGLRGEKLPYCVNPEVYGQFNN
jgi:glyoxylate reductase